MRVSRVYEDYLRYFSQKYPDAHTLSYDRLRSLFYWDGFGTSDSWTTALETLGYETFAAVQNYELLQKAWAREHSCGFDDLRWPKQILLAQARHFRPDVVWLNAYDLDLIHALRDQVPEVRLIFQGVGGTLNLSFPFRELDFVISCAPELVETLRRQGVRAHHVDHAFDPRILPRLPPPGPPTHDLTFAGQVVAGPGFHRERQDLLSRLAAECRLEIFTSAYSPRRGNRLSPETLWRGLARPVQFAVAHGVPASALERVPKVRSLMHLKFNPSIAPMLRPAVYGLDMYRTLRDSKISLNVHADSSPTHASNQRLYEVTGVGSCLLTDWKANLPELFDPDREVVAYRTPQECTEKVHWLLAHAEERAAIARAGQKRCLAQHGHRHRAPLIDAAIRDSLSRPVSRPRDSRRT